MHDNEDGHSGGTVNVDVDHRTMMVTLMLPPRIDDMNDGQLQGMVRQITRIQAVWEPRGYHVGFGCVESCPIMMPRSGRHANGAPGRPHSDRGRSRGGQ